MIDKGAMRDRLWQAVMVVAFAVGALMAGYLLTRDALWSDPVFTPILALCLGLLVQMPLLLILYWRRRNDWSVEAGAADIELIHGRWRRELYWWVGEGPVVGALVTVIFAAACLGVSALAGLSSGAPVARVLAPLVALVIGLVVIGGVGVMRIKWLRERLQERSEGNS